MEVALPKANEEEVEAFFFDGTLALSGFGFVGLCEVEDVEHVRRNKNIHNLAKVFIIWHIDHKMGFYV